MRGAKPRIRLRLRVLVIVAAVVATTWVGAARAAGDSIQVQVPGHAKEGVQYSVTILGNANTSERLYLFLDFHACGPNPAVEHARADGDIWTVNGAFEKKTTGWVASTTGEDHACVYLQDLSQPENAASGVTTSAAEPFFVAAVPEVPTYDGAPMAGKDPQVRPVRIVYSGDGSGLLAGHGNASYHPKFGRLRWSVWNATVARASGANWLDNCIPDCAGGRFSSYPIRIKLFRPELEYGYDVFTRMKVTYIGRMPSFIHSRAQTWMVEHNGGQFFWRFPT